MKRILTILLLFAFLLTACSEKSSTDEKNTIQNVTSSTEQTSEYDPFARADDDTSSGTIGSFSCGVEWENGKELVLDYAPTVSFEYYVDNSGKDSDFGLLIFLNGVRQPYRTGENSENQIMHIFDVKQDEHQVQTIAFEPVVGEKGDEVSVEIITMFQPDYINTEKSSYGFSHRISSLYPSSLSVTQETDLIEPNVCSKYEVTPITEEMRQEFNQMSSTGGYGGNALDSGIFIETLKNDVFYTPADRLNSESDITPFTMNDSVTLCMYGGELCTYRVSMYINHELVTGAFDGADYIDITPSKNSICKKVIDLKALNLSLQDDNHLYFIAVPIYTSDNFESRMVLKSASVTLDSTK